MLEAAVFYLLAGLMIGSSLAILLTRNIVRAAMWLLGALGAAAGLFLLLAANFIAAVQLIVYAGGVLILIVFGIMLTSRGPVERERAPRREVVVSLFIAALLLIGLLVAQLAAPWPAISPIDDNIAATPVRTIGRELLTTWLVPFEVISILLLAVMIGAAYLARPRRTAGGPHA